MNDRLLMSPPDVGVLEEEYVLRALRSGWVAPTGPEVTAFEHEVAQLTGTRQRHNGRHTERPRQNRAVAGRSTLLGDETQNERRVQQSGVGRRGCGIRGGGAHCHPSVHPMSS